MAFLFVLPPILLLLTLNIIKQKKKNGGAKLPPSPWKLPLIGNLHHLIGVGDPHRTLCNLSRKHGPVMHLKLGQVDHIIISSQEAAREILKTHDLNFASRPVLIGPTIVFGNRDMIFAPYGNYWRHLRKICVLELLSASRVKSFCPIREEENSSMVASIISMSVGKPVAVNLTELLLLLPSTTTARAAFGTECRQASKFIEEVNKASKLGSGFALADLFPSLSFVGRLIGTNGKFEAIRRHIEVIFDEIIDDHQMRQKPIDEKDVPENLLDVLLKLKDETGLNFPRENIRAILFDMFGAGTETTGSTTIWAMAELVRHPAVMEKVQNEVRQVAKVKGRIDDSDIQELPYLKLVIKETLRLHPPLPLLLPRVCKETCKIGGYEIPSGSRVIINAWAIGRDPLYWEDAESFIPERFEGSSMDFKGDNFQYLPFGGGRRMCPGIVFGLVNIELTLAQLLFHFDWEDPEGNEIDMAESFGMTLTKKLDISFIATPRFPLPS